MLYAQDAVFQYLNIIYIFISDGPNLREGGIEEMLAKRIQSGNERIGTGTRAPNRQRVGMLELWDN